MRSDSFEELLQQILADKDARVAAIENDVRRQLASALEEARTRKRLSIRGLAKQIGTSMSQVQRVLHLELGGSLTLRTIVRACDALGLRLTLRAVPEEQTLGRLVLLRGGDWHGGTRTPGTERAPRTPVPSQCGVPMTLAGASWGTQGVGGTPAIHGGATS